MSKNKVISITDMTQKAYDCILQQNYTKKTCQQYWYCGVVPIRRYFKQKGIELYSPKSINDCLTWYQEQFKQGTVYSTNFRRSEESRQSWKILQQKNHIGGSR